MRQTGYHLRIGVLILALVTLCCTQNDFPLLQGPYLGQIPPGTTPELFAPGIMTTEFHEHSSPAFSPDGNDVYWSVFFNFWGPQVILYMELENGRWTPPRVAPFSGQYSDGNPCFTPDGRKIIFESRRPTHEDGPYTGETDLWMVERGGSGWCEPRHLGWTVNSDKWDRGPSTSANGNLYFCSMRKGGYGQMDLYCSKWMDGSYTEPENLGHPINTAGYESWPFIAPDERYILYESDSGALFASFRKEDGSWSEPVSMAQTLNFSGAQDRFPLLSNDGKYLFFVSNRWLGNRYPDTRLNLEQIKARAKSMSNGMGNIYWVDSSIIDKLRSDDLH